jgi:hypothetical protein
MARDDDKARTYVTLNGGTIATRRIDHSHIHQFIPTKAS